MLVEVGARVPDLDRGRGVVEEYALRSEEPCATARAADIDANIKRHDKITKELEEKPIIRNECTEPRREGEAGVQLLSVNINSLRADPTR